MLVEEESALQKKMRWVLQLAQRPERARRRSAPWHIALQALKLWIRYCGAADQHEKNVVKFTYRT